MSDHNVNIPVFKVAVECDRYRGRGESWAYRRPRLYFPWAYRRPRLYILLWAYRRPRLYTLLHFMDGGFLAAMHRRDAYAPSLPPLYRRDAYTPSLDPLYRTPMRPENVYHDFFQEYS